MTASRDKQGRLLPTGECWCGCGDAAATGKFWIPGHDTYAHSALIKMKYGDVAEFLVHNSYGPGDRNLRREFEAWKKKHGK